MNKLSLIIFTLLMSVNALFSQNMTFNNGDYPKEWKEIQTLEEQGLPKSALEKVSALYLRAKADKNPSQIIKALIHRSKFAAQLEEDGFVKAVYAMQTEAETAAFPELPILQSMLAEVYSGYLENNVWRFQNRTKTTNFQNDDLRTWDISKINTESARLYKASLANDQSKSVAIANFNAITNTDNETTNADKLQPTLYDFLANRAIAFFTNEKTYLTKPAYKFELDGSNTEGAFAPPATFIAIKFDQKDSTSEHLWALKLMQDVMRFHLKDADPVALIDADLKRLSLVKEHSTAENKEELYIKYLTDLQTKYNDLPVFVEISYELAQFYNEKAQSYKPNPENIGKDDYKKAMALCKAAVQKFPKAYGAKNCRQLINSITEPFLEAQIEEVNTPSKAILTLVKFRNVGIANFKIVKLTDKTDKRQFDNEEQGLSYFNSLKAVKEWSVNMPNDGDFQAHSTEIKTDRLPLGKYLLMASDNPNFDLKNNGKVSRMQFYVSNIAFAAREGDTSAREFVVMDRTLGTPLKGVTVEFWQDKYNPTTRKEDKIKIGSAVSNVMGFVVPKIAKDVYYTVKFIFGKDTLATDNGYSNYSYRNNPSVKQEFTQFFLDRGIYRPSQTIFFKALVLEKDKEGLPKIIPNRTVTITLMDANYQKVTDVKLTTNEFGTVNGSFTAPVSGLLGQMHLMSDLNGSQFFNVEEYKRPKFEVKLPPLEGTFVLNQIVKVKGNAKAFAGSSIDGAKVTYRVVREARFPYYSWRGWNPWNTEGAQEIAHGEVLTDAKGDFVIPFTALPNKTIPTKQKPVFDYKIEVDVVDVTGETHSASTSVSVGYVALALSMDIPARLNRRTISSFKINTNNLNGQPLASKVNIKIELLTSTRRPLNTRYWEIPDTQTMTKEEFTRDFPLFSYKNEGKIENWAVKRKIFDEKFTTTAPLSREGNLLNVPNLKTWEPGEYRITLSATDASGELLETKDHFTLYDLEDLLIPVNKVLFTVFEKTKFTPGEQATFFAGTATESQNVLFEIERNNRIDTREWLDIKGFRKLLFRIEEGDRGNIFYHLTYVKNNRFQHEAQTIEVPWTNKELNIEYQTFRDKLLPGQDEEWRLKISGRNKEKVAAEMAVAMYDASLDQFKSNDWSLNLYPNGSARKNFGASTFHALNTNPFYRNEGEGNVEGDEGRTYRSLNWFGFQFGEAYQNLMVRSAAVPMSAPVPVMKEGNAAPVSTKPSTDMSDAKYMEEVVVAGYGVSKTKKVTGSVSQPTNEVKSPASQPVKLRTNLNETVFFFPTLMTDEEGNIVVKFKMNEALTRWKFLGVAHTKDLKVGLTQKEIVTQKDLMVFPNAPRFFREGDAIEFTAKVSNLSNETMKGAAVLQLFDALTMQPVDVLLENTRFEVPFEAKAGESAPLMWRLRIPTGKVQAVTYRVIARAGDFSDGEENTLPVLTNRMLVTETLPLSIRGGETKKFEFKALKEGNSPTLTNHKLTLEFTQNPAWYAVQALPYLMEYPYDCTEQIFSRYYANALATNVANSYPKIKTVFDRWKNTDVAALQSNLSKNQELKSALLAETPWVLDAQREEVQKKNIGLLFDLNKMSNESQVALKKMSERQLSNGGFSWFPGGNDNWFITQYLTEGFGHLDALGVKELKTDATTTAMVQKAVQFCDERAAEYFADLEKQATRGSLKMADVQPSSIIVHYLYTRSFFKSDIPNREKVFNFFLNQSEKFWLKYSQYEQGLIALAMNRFGKAETTTKIVKSLKERSLNSDEMGMYWKGEGGYYWYQMPVETQSLMIELFNEVGDRKAVDDLKVWLLKNKQTTAWKTTKATASAVYALLKTGGGDWLLEDKDISISLNNKELDQTGLQKEAGTGYFKTTFKPNEITASMGDIKVTNPNKVVAWGAVYWQYFENLDQIKKGTQSKETPLKIVKQLFREENSDLGKTMQPITDATPLSPGDKIKVRIEIRVDRDMEFVHLKDMRASGFEPTNVLSNYKYQGGLGYYESTKDASTNFFFDYLPKGTFVFEYPMVVNHRGDFSNGITTIQCMYAPEFSSHSEGVRVRVNGK